MDREEQVTRKPKTRIVTRDRDLKLCHTGSTAALLYFGGLSPTAIWDSQGKLATLILCAKSVV